MSSTGDEGARVPGARPRRRGRRGGRRRRKGTSASPQTAAARETAATRETAAAHETAAAGPRIYTRGGDRGETGLIGGQRVAKDHPRVEAYGAVDELNASLGAARALTREPDLIEVFDRIQHRLFDLGAELATPGASGTPSAITEAEVKVLEGVIDLYQETLAPLREFILPAGTDLGAALHVARTVCRRAERRAVSLARQEAVNPEVVRYLNRLSDLLFVLARVGNERGGVPDVTWKKASPPPVAAQDSRRPGGSAPAASAAQGPVAPAAARVRRRRGRRRPRTKPQPPNPQG